MMFCAIYGNAGPIALVGRDRRAAKGQRLRITWLCLMNKNCGSTSGLETPLWNILIFGQSWLL